MKTSLYFHWIITRVGGCTCFMGLNLYHLKYRYCNKLQRTQFTNVSIPAIDTTSLTVTNVGTCMSVLYAEVERCAYDDRRKRNMCVWALVEEYYVLWGQILLVKMTRGGCCFFRTVSRIKHTLWSNSNLMKGGNNINKKKIRN